MALVLCIGDDAILLETRKLLLEAAGYLVVTALGEAAAREACLRNSFNLAIIGQGQTRVNKVGFFQLIRQHCPDARILEMYLPSTGRILPEADDWLLSDPAYPAELPKKVGAMLAESAPAD